MMDEREAHSVWWRNKVTLIYLFVTSTIGAGYAVAHLAGLIR